ncbi:ATP-binding protein [Nonomuraea sp. NPDC049504]|uniref:ATP-binding protein n=1 Tax=Nonomuraea sp. NPDC049504 TaxID=3154729 RepID=UPI0034426741
MSADFRTHWEITPDLARMRANVELFGVACGLKGDRLQDLLIAVNEGMSNALEHGDMPGTVTLFERQVGVGVEIVDSGNSLHAGHLTLEPSPDAKRGMGLWIIRRICGEVRIDHPGGRSRLSFYVGRADAAEDDGEAMPGTAAEPL